MLVGPRSRSDCWGLPRSGGVFTLPFSQQEILKRSLVPGDETTNHLQSPTVPSVVFPDPPDPFSAVLSQSLLYSVVVFAYKFSKFFSLSLE